MTRKYKLLKDLPGCAAGTIFKYDDADEFAYAENLTSVLTKMQQIRPSIADANPDWFERVPERCTRCGHRCEGYFPELTCICRPLTDVKSCARCASDHVGVNGVEFLRFWNHQKGSLTSACVLFEMSRSSCRS